MREIAVLSEVRIDLSIFRMLVHFFFKYIRKWYGGIESMLYALAIAELFVVRNKQYALEVQIILKKSSSVRFVKCLKRDDGRNS